MFDEFNSLLNIGHNFLPTGKLVLLTDDRVDSNFIIVHFLNTHLKGGNSVCILSLAQSFNHYNNVALKFGINFTKSKDQGQLLFIDGLKACLEAVSLNEISSPTQESNSNHPLAFIFARKSDIDSLKNLYFLLKEQVNVLKKRERPILLIIDDLSILTSLGVSSAEIIDFIRYIRNILNLPSQNSTDCLLVATHRDSDIEDEDIDTVQVYCQHHSNLEINVKGLKTGFCKDVHGQVIYISISQKL